MRIVLVFAILITCTPACSEPTTPSDAPPLRGGGAFKKLGPPRDGDWLDRFDEPGQSFERYVASEPVRPDGNRHTLSFVAVGERDENQARAAAAAIEFAGLWFGLPTRTLPPKPLPEEDWQRVRHFDWLGAPTVQYHTDWFLNRLLPPLVPDDAVCLLAITHDDLYPDETWNFVFGMSTFRRRVAVCSFLRYGAAFEGRRDTAETRRLALLRGLKVVTHEIGHAFGLRHCIVYLCNMNGSNSLDESDRQPLHLCPECLRKLEWNLGFDPEERYRDLLDFLERHRLEEQAAWVLGRLRRGF